MRIGIDYTAAVRQTAGIGRYTRLLIQTLAILDQDGDYLLFSAGRQPGGVDWPDNFSLRQLPLSDRHMAIIWQRLRLPLPIEWLTGRLDLFHSPDFVLPPVRRAQTLLTVHDLSFMRWPECSSPPLLEYLMAAVPRSVARADRILADSECTRQDLVELLDVPAERIDVVYAGVEERFRPQADKAVDAVKARYGIERPYVLGLGTLQPRKNFARLIEAFALARERAGIPHALVIGGGEGWLSRGIHETIDRLGLREDVRLIGFVDDQDLPALYTGADLFAFPSLYEGFGIPVLEAMGCQTPVVTSRASSLPEVAGEAALLIDPTDVEELADALVRGLGDSELRDRMVLAGKGQVDRFSWRAAAQSLLQVYRMMGGHA